MLLARIVLSHFPGSPKLASLTRIDYNLITMQQSVHSRYFFGFLDEVLLRFKYNQKCARSVPTKDVRNTTAQTSAHHTRGGRQRRECAPYAGLARHQGLRCSDRPACGTGRVQDSP